MVFRWASRKDKTRSRVRSSHHTPNPSQGIFSQRADIALPSYCQLRAGFFIRAHPDSQSLTPLPHWMRRIPMTRTAPPDNWRCGMYRMNTNNGFWSYFWSSITGFLTMLTLQDVLFAFGAVVSALFAWLTYRSNDIKNKAAIEEDRKRTEILKAAYARGDVSNITEGARIVQSIETELQDTDNGATAKTT